MTTGKSIALTRWTFVGRVISLLFNMLSSMIIAFLPRSKHLLISWLQSSSAVILEPPKIKSVTVSTVSPCIFHEVMGLDAIILVFWMLSFKPTFSSPLSLSTFDCADHIIWLCRSQQTAENSSTDENTRPPYPPPEKSVCRSRSNC